MLHRSRVLHLLSVLLMATSSAPDVPGQPLDRRIKQLGERIVARMELRTMARPRWAVRAGAPRFTFVVIADIHLRPGRSTALLEQALAYVRRVRPSLVLILGDNVSERGVAAQRRLKRLLDQGLRCPYHIIKGDNDARHFPAVFGATHWSFVFGGVHFLASGLDVDAEGQGIGWHHPATLQWLAGRIDRHRTRPTLFLHHESLFPPLFLGAGRLAGVLVRRSQVRGLLTGHLHFDVGLQLGQRSVIGCPGLGPNPRHGLKVAEVYSDGIVLRTHERVDGRYRAVDKWQRVRFGPFGLGPMDGSPRLTDRAALPARPTQFDARLARNLDRLRSALNRLGGPARR